jgi:glycosyltransferase involved in cell wall biosynthesis
MDIVFVGSRGIPAKYGGNETFVDEVSKRLVKDGFRIGVVCEGRKFAKDSFHGITRIHTYSLQSKGLTIPFLNDIISTIYLLCKYNKETNIFYYVTPDGSIAGMIARMFGKKVIVNTDGVEWKRLLKRKKYVPFYQVPIYTITMVAMYFAEYLACKISYVTVADSLAIKKHLERHSPRHVVYIPYGARDLMPVNGLTRSTIDEVLQAFCVESEQYYLTIGRIVPENNIHMEIEGYSNAHSKKKLLIIGDFTSNSSYVKYLYKLKGSNVNVLFHTPVYDQQILGILRAHCFGYIHAYEVGGTNPSLLEQMLFGKPILAYNVPFNKEVLQHGGIYFDSGDGLSVKITNLENNEIDFEYSNVQQDRLKQQYNWDAVVNEYEKLFRDAMK